jgi:outer membrane protein OmpA-like peptidoglycan-associated protein
MKKKIVIALLAIIPVVTNAQVGSLFNKVKNKVNARVNNDIDKSIDQTLDKAEGKDNAGASTSAAPAKETVEADKPVKSFSKYDFIPGEKILFAEDLSQEAIAELPTGWNTNGSGEVVTLEGLSGKWLRLHNPFIYLSSNTKSFTENYTAEFDVILQLKNNGWMYPTFSCGFFDKNDLDGTDNSFLTDYNKFAAITATIYPGENGSSRAMVESFTSSKAYFKSEPKMYAELDKYYGKTVHVAIQIQKQRFRMWINESKVFDVPKAIDTSHKMNQVFFKIGSTNYKEEQYGIYISNIKVATGLPDTRHKLIEEGKFSTTGILFDLNSATVKPESYGVVKEIAGVIKENPTIKLKIVGHTSSDGDDKANLELSKKRADAVKDLLVTEFSIDPSTISTEGKGETQPVADNKTKEGKLQNRRVEFIKL